MRHKASLLLYVFRTDLDQVLVYNRVNPVVKNCTVAIHVILYGIKVYFVRGNPGLEIT